MQIEDVICTDSNPQPNQNGNSINTNHNSLNHPIPYSSMSLTSAEKENILSKYREDLRKIDDLQQTIEALSSSSVSLIYRYPDTISRELFEIIDDEVHISPSILYLYLVNEIIQKIFLNRNNNIDPTINNNLDEEFKQSLIDSFFPYIKDICFTLYYLLNDEIQKKVNNIMGIWRNMKIFKKDSLESFEYELKMNFEPDFKGENEEMELLKTLVTDGSFRIEPYLVEFSREFQELERKKDNKNRKNILEMDKDLINRQLRLYNKNVQKLRDINLLLKKIKEYEESEDKMKEENK